MSLWEDILERRNSEYQKPKGLKRTLPGQDVALRKQQRFERAMKFRTEALQASWVNLDTLYPQIYTVSDIPSIQLAVQQDSRDALLFAAQAMRKMLVLDRAPAIHELSEAGLLGYTTQWILRNDHPQLQYESILIASSVASCSIRFTQTLVNEGLLGGLVAAVQSLNEDIREEALSALASAASVCLPAPEMLAELNLVQIAMQVCATGVRMVTEKNVCWLLSTIAKGRCLEHICQYGLAFLVHQLASSDLEVLTDTCHVLSCLSERGIGRVQILLDLNVVPRLIDLLSSSEYGVQLAALRAVGNISTGNDAQAEVLLHSDVLPLLLTLMSSTRKQIRKETMWILSNLCAGTVDHIKIIVDCNIIPKIVGQISAQDLEICREACWVVYNIVLNGTPGQIQVVLDTPVVFNLCRLMEETDSQMLTVVLYCLKALLQDAQVRFQGDSGINPIKELIEASSGIPCLEELVTHIDYEVQKTASFIMEQFFEDIEPTALSEDDNFLI